MLFRVESGAFFLVFLFFLSLSPKSLSDPAAARSARLAGGACTAQAGGLERRCAWTRGSAFHSKRLLMLSCFSVLLVLDENIRHSFKEIIKKTKDIGYKI